MSRRALLVSLTLLVGHVEATFAQILSQRGFLQGAAFAFPQRAPNDPTRGVVDLLVRNEVFVKPRTWIQFASGLDFRANSHDQIEEGWGLDFSDRGERRPRLSIRRLTATMTRKAFTVDVGKQFIRWGKADIVNPTDRFAPRDFLNVVDPEFVAVTGLHATVQVGSHTIEAVWVPRFTPSRTPLIDQRWAAGSVEEGTDPIVETRPTFPAGSQSGLRWGHVAEQFEYSISFYDGFNHQPDFRVSAQGDPPAAIEIARQFPPIRTYGGDAAVPVRWFTIKAEAAYSTSSSPSTDEYVLYVLQLERQSGEWVFVGGYAGEAVTRRRSLLTFAPDRGTSRAFVARAAYTIDPNRSVTVEGAVRENGDGAYAKAEYSQARGQHWRATLTAVAIGGHSDDFLGQYHRNSHLLLTTRYSF